MKIFRFLLCLSILSFTFLSRPLFAEETHPKAHAENTGDLKTTFQKSLQVVEKTVKSENGKKESAEIIKEKKEFLNKLAKIIEQKLAMLGQKNISLNVLEDEIIKIQKRSVLLAAEKSRTAAKRMLFEQKVQSLEQDISIKKQVLDLQGGKESDLEKQIRASEDQLGKAQYQLDYLVEHERLVDLRISLVEEYKDLLARMRTTTIRKILFTPAKLHMEQKEAAGLAVVFIFLAAVLLFRKKVNEVIQWAARGNRDLAAFLRFSLSMAFLYYAAYWIASILGYHLLCRYTTKRVAFSAGVIFLLIAGYKLLTGLVRYFFVKPTITKSTGQKSKHPYFHIFCTFLGVAAFLFSIYWICEIWGAGSNGWKTLWHLSQKPFFEAGDTKLSVWLIAKVMIIIWFFLAASKVMDGFLYSRVYPRTQLDETIQYAFSVIIKYVAVIVAAFTALKLLGVEIGAITVLAGTVGIGIGFGLQDLAKNFISGLVILVERPVKIGDFVEIGGLPGRVKSINARSTVVDTFDNISVLVPNAEFMSQNVINWSYSDKITKSAVKVGVAYGSDLELVRSTLLSVAQNHPKVLKNPEPSVGFESFGDSSLNFSLSIWTDDPSHRGGVHSDLNFAIDKVFREKGIEIPFPQREVHIKSENPKI